MIKIKLRNQECPTTDAILNCRNCKSFEPSCRNNTDCSSACCKVFCSPSNCYTCTSKKSLHSKSNSKK